MKALVCVKRVLDYNIRARIKKDNSGIDLTNAKMSINPFDEIAVEEVVRLKEQGNVNEIIALSIGSSECSETIRSALAIGADRGILVSADSDLTPLNVAKIIKSVCEKENIELVVLGKQAIDDDCNQTGQMLAELLGWSQGTFISSLAINNKEVIVTREVDEGLEELSCSIPAVLTTDLRLNTPRYPKLPDIMKAKRKPIEITSVDDLKVTTQTYHTILTVEEPKQRSGGKIVQDVAELMDCLHTKAKVI